MAVVSNRQRNQRIKCAAAAGRWERRGLTLTAKIWVSDAALPAYLYSVDTPYYVIRDVIVIFEC